MEASPISTILVKSDSKGDRLLFRFPIQKSTEDEQQKQNEIPASPFSMANIANQKVDDEVLSSSASFRSNVSADGLLKGLNDEVLSTLFAVKSELCNRKFELKINDLRFVGYPTLIQSSKYMINIVFALYAQASYSIVKCYYELSKRLGSALTFEEKRCEYLSKEMALMLKIHDTVEQEKHLSKDSCAFTRIIDESSLAQCLRDVHLELCNSGLLNITINQSLTLCFCLPQKAHQFHKPGSMVEPEAIDKCLNSLKPYHGMLLLVDPIDLLDCIPPCGARILLQLIEVYNPLKSLQNMASDAEMLIEHVYTLVGHLVYWAKAIVIYPLCESNVYVTTPDAPLHTNSVLVDKFAAKFPGMSLFEVISDFSLPTSIGHLTTPLQHPSRQGRLAEMVLWMLKHHLLMQLHTYVQFMTTSDEFDEELARDRVERRAIENSVERELPNGHSAETISSDLVMQFSSSHRSTYSPSLPVDFDDDCIEIDESERIKKLLENFEEHDRIAISKVPAASNVEDLTLMVKLWQKGYFKGEDHLEEIIYFENLRRSQLLQLLDKFRDVLIMYETEDPAIASLYS
uniref:GATOR complex protein NPRL3 n=1 Tax=Culicoides sonorensis TaxID=179676 RepID=A0A336LA23_CULSO